MKFDQSKAAGKVTILAMLLVVAGLFGSSTQAQSPYRGKFTLEQSIRWGRAQLPAGEYRFSIESFGNKSIVKVVSARRGLTVALIPCNIVESSQGPSVLILGHRSGQYVAHTLRFQELGESFIFDPQLAARAAREEAQQTDAVPVFFAKN